jgi:transposase
MIARIYKAEKRLKSMNLSAEELTVYRIEEVLEKLTKLQTHLEKKATEVPPSSSMGKAVSYALEQLPKIKRYASVSCATLDNNAVERAIRPFVTGRKNWHIAATPSGAHASAAWYSLIESAKSAGIEAHQYITYVLDHVPEVQKTGDWASLLPENTPLT